MDVAILEIMSNAAVCSFLVDFLAAMTAIYRHEGSFCSGAYIG
jgi:hypothetical protein